MTLNALAGWSGQLIRIGAIWDGGPPPLTTLSVRVLCNDVVETCSSMRVISFASCILGLKTHNALLIGRSDCLLLLSLLRKCSLLVRVVRVRRMAKLSEVINL